MSVGRSQYGDPNWTLRGVARVVEFLSGVYRAVEHFPLVYLQIKRMRNPISPNTHDDECQVAR